MATIIRYKKTHLPDAFIIDLLLSIVPHSNFTYPPEDLDNLLKKKTENSLLGKGV